MKRTAEYLYFILPALCLFPFFSPPLALLCGIVLSLVGIENPIPDMGKLAKYILQISIVLVGFGMSLTEVLQTGKTGFVITAVTVFVTFLVGLLLGKIFKVDKSISTLVSGGTSICGGSAIAAIAPVINAKNNQISFALVVIFVLNAVALFIFPVIGHWLGMDQAHFGYWAAIAIHDTSSVVGACAIYGDVALQTGTTVKLTRTLWIIPLVLVISLINRNKASKITIPWFILFFLLAIIAVTYVPGLDSISEYLVYLGRRGMTVSLFFIGASIKLEEVKSVGIYPFLQGICLWIVISVLSLVWILAAW